MNRYIKNIGLAACSALLLASCQKMSRPDFSEYPVDANPPGGPLSFYLAFDGTTANPLMNSVDSIRAAFPAENPLTSVDGISGKAVKGENKKYIKFSKPNDWAKKATSFSISFWYKGDAQTKNNTGGNGPEYIMSFKSSNGHWSGASMLVFLEGNNTACAIKTMFVDKNNSDAWFTWEGGNSIPGLMNNAWHHITLVYNASNSTMTCYVDGAARPTVPTWGTHGGVNFDESKITEFRVGAGPSNSIDSDDWLACSWKGSIDQIRMYTTALTAAEVSALFTAKK